MDDQNGTIHTNQDSTIEEMKNFKFDEETTERTIIFDSSDTEDTEPDFKTEPLSPTAVEETLHITDNIVTNTSFSQINPETKKEKIYENDLLNQTRKTELKININTNTNTAHYISNISCMNETSQNNGSDTSKRKLVDPITSDSYPKYQKTGFPRTKITSKRPVNKFPGKMESMKNANPIVEQKSPETERESLQNNCDTRNRLAQDSGRKTPESEQRLMAALRIVAENLIHISPYLNRYVHTKQFNTVEFQIASDAFKNAKLHYFSLSYSTVASTILPYANNLKFMQNFYNLTFQLANQKRIPNPFNANNLQVLCSEMIEWTRVKMSRSTKYGLSRVPETNHVPPTNSNHVNVLESLKRHINSSNPAIVDNNLKDKTLIDSRTEDVTLVFPAENVGTAIKISYNPALTSQLSMTSQSCTNVSSNITVQENINVSNCPVRPQMQPQHHLQATSSFQQKRHHPIQNAIQNKIVLPNSHCNIRLNKFNQVPSSVPNKPYTGSNIPSRYEQFNSNPRQNLQTDMMSQKAPCIGQHQTQLDQTDPSHRNFIKLNHYPQERSTSRDSGFFSPVQDSFQPDCLITSPSGITPSPPGLPLPPPYPSNPPVNQQRFIESQSNAKTLSTIGSCLVCERLTSLTCLGCNNTYYCGSTCQNLDWNRHSKYCRNS